MAFETQMDFFPITVLSEPEQLLSPRVPCAKMKSYGSTIDNRIWSDQCNELSRICENTVRCHAEKPTMKVMDSSEVDKGGTVEKQIKTGVGDQATKSSQFDDGFVRNFCTHVKTLVEKANLEKSTAQEFLKLCDMLKGAASPNMRANEFKGAASPNMRANEFKGAASPNMRANEFKTTGGQQAGKVEDDKLKAITLERNELRDKVKQLQQQLQKGESKAGDTISKLSQGLLSQDSYIDKLENKCEELKHNQSIIENLMAEKEILECQVDTLKEELFTARCSVHKLDCIQRENAFLANQVQKFECALADYDEQYKGLMRVVEDLGCSGGIAQSNCCDGIEDLAVLTGVVVYEIKKRMEEFGYCAGDSLMVENLKSDCESVCTDAINKVRILMEQNEQLRDLNERLIDENKDLVGKLGQHGVKITTLADNLDKLDRDVLVTNKNATEIGKNLNQSAGLVKDIGRYQARNSQLLESTLAADGELVENLNRMLKEQQEKNAMCQAECDLLRKMATDGGAVIDEKALQKQLTDVVPVVQAGVIDTTGKCGMIGAIKTEKEVADVKQPLGQEPVDKPIGKVDSEQAAVKSVGQVAAVKDAGAKGLNDEASVGKGAAGKTVVLEVDIENKEKVVKDKDGNEIAHQKDVKGTVDLEITKGAATSKDAKRGSVSSARKSPQRRSTPGASGRASDANKVGGKSGEAASKGPSSDSTSSPGKGAIVSSEGAGGSARGTLASPTSTPGRGSKTGTKAVSDRGPGAGLRDAGDKEASAEGQGAGAVAQKPRAAPVQKSEAAGAQEASASASQEPSTSAAQKPATAAVQRPGSAGRQRASASAGRDPAGGQGANARKGGRGSGAGSAGGTAAAGDQDGAATRTPGAGKSPATAAGRRDSISGGASARSNAKEGGGSARRGSTTPTKKEPIARSSKAEETKAGGGSSGKGRRTGRQARTGRSKQSKADSDALDSRQSTPSKPKRTCDPNDHACVCRKCPYKDMVTKICDMGYQKMIIPKSICFEDAKLASEKCRRESRSKGGRENMESAEQQDISDENNYKEENSKEAYKNFVTQYSLNMSYQLEQGIKVEHALKQTLDALIDACGFCFCGDLVPKGKFYIICHKILHRGFECITFKELIFMHEKIVKAAEGLRPGHMIAFIAKRYFPEENTKNICCKCKEELCCLQSEENISKKINELEINVLSAKQFLHSLRAIPPIMEATMTKKKTTIKMIESPCPTSPRKLIDSDYPIKKQTTKDDTMSRYNTQDLRSFTDSIKKYSELLQ